MRKVFLNVYLNGLKWRDLTRFHNFRRVIFIFQSRHSRPLLVRNLAIKLKKCDFSLFGRKFEKPLPVKFVAKISVEKFVEKKFSKFCFIQLLI